MRCDHCAQNSHARAAENARVHKCRVLSVELSKGQKALSCSSEYISPTSANIVLKKAARGCLVVGLLGTLTLGGSVAQAAPADRSLSMYNIHTKESLSITYKRQGKYDRKALDKINWFMRDWRNNQTIKMDPKLIDLMWEVYNDLGAKKPVHVVSSYRSVTTNNKLRRMGRKVARNSQHTKGRAVDLYFPDVSSKKIRENALIREIGGVGYYPRSLSKGFVHIDTGSVRHWPRMRASTFARLFPHGKSKHRPRSYPSKALYAKYKNKTPERHIQMALASKGGKTPDLRGTPTIQLASLSSKVKPQKKKLKAPVLAQKPETKPTAPAPIVLTSAKQLEEKAQAAPASQTPELPAPVAKTDEQKIIVQQLASLARDTSKDDPLNKPVAHGLKPVEVATLTPLKPRADDPANKPIAHGLKPVEVASSMDVKIIPASAKPGEDEEDIKAAAQKAPEITPPAKIEIASLTPVLESDTSSEEEPIKSLNKQAKDKLPLQITFSKATLSDPTLNKNVILPRVNRAEKGDLLMTSFYKSKDKLAVTSSLTGQMGKAISMKLSLSWEDETGLHSA